MPRSKRHARAIRVAVVASEVRSLAQRSASAAKEIKDLIHDSVGKVAEGSRLVSESGRHLNEIVASVKKVSDVVGEISNASQEQAASAEEISRAVLQMDESTQQNAAMVEEASAAAGSMNDQAARLTELTAFFRLADAGGDPDRVDSGAAARHVPGERLVGSARAPGVVAPHRRRLSGRSAQAVRRGGPLDVRNGRDRGVREESSVGLAAPPGPLAPSQELLGAASGADWDEF